MNRKMNYTDRMLALERHMKGEIKARAAEMERLIKRYDLGGIDLESEYEKIKRKESYLSARKRQIVIDIVEARKFDAEVSNIIDFDIEMHTANAVSSSAVLRDGTEAKPPPQRCPADARAHGKPC